MSVLVLGVSHHTAPIALLDEVATAATQVPSLLADLVGSAAYNEALGRRRANAVVNYLVSQGVAADRLTARGYGEDRPRFPNDSEANRAKNRRVELVPMN